MTENNIEYTIDPAKNASPEQLRFMVSLEQDQIYVPCTDEMLTSLLDKRLEPPLLRQYNERWDRIVRLIEDCRADDYTKKKVLALCEHKYRQALTHPTLIPSRLMKRLNTIFLTQSGQDDPSRERKRLLNRRAFAFAQSQEFKNLLYASPPRSCPAPPSRTCASNWTAWNSSACFFCPAGPGYGRTADGRRGTRTCGGPSSRRREFRAPARHA